MKAGLKFRKVIGKYLEWEYDPAVQQQIMTQMLRDLEEAGINVVATGGPIEDRVRAICQEEIEKYKADLEESDYYRRMGEDM